MTAIPLSSARILLVVGGGIAAYKSLELIRRLRDRGTSVRVVLTAAAKHFITPLSAATLSGEPVRDDLFSLTDEVADRPYRTVARRRSRRGRAGDGQSSRPHGRRPRRRSGDHLAAGDRQTRPCGSRHERQDVGASRNAAATSRALRGRRRRCSSVPRRWPKWRAASSAQDGWPSRRRSSAAIDRALACWREPSVRLPAGSRRRGTAERAGTSSSRPGPTYEPIDPVRFLGNRSSGRQGSCARASRGRRGRNGDPRISGPVTLPDPTGRNRWFASRQRRQMRGCGRRAALPADAFVGRSRRRRPAGRGRRADARDSRKGSGVRRRCGL